MFDKACHIHPKYTSLWVDENVEYSQLFEDFMTLNGLSDKYQFQSYFNKNNDDLLYELLCDVLSHRPPSLPSNELVVIKSLEVVQSWMGTRTVKKTCVSSLFEYLNSEKYSNLLQSKCYWCHWNETLFEKEIARIYGNSRYKYFTFYHQKYFNINSQPKKSQVFFITIARIKFTRI